QLRVLALAVAGGRRASGRRSTLRSHSQERNLRSGCTSLPRSDMGRTPSTGHPASVAGCAAGRPGAGLEGVTGYLAAVCYTGVASGRHRATPGCLAEGVLIAVRRQVMQWSDISFSPAPRTLRQFAGLWLLFFLGWACLMWWGRGNGGVALLLAGIAVLVG